MYSILVSDAETRKAFDIISILKSAFPNVRIICGNTDGSRAMLRHLKRIFKSNVENLRTNDAALCLKDFESISEKYVDRELVFVPTEEKTIALMYEFVRTFGQRNYVFILPDEKVYHQFRNKKGLNDFCSENNLNAPAHYSVEDIEGLKPEQYPLLLKPCIGSGSEGQFRLYQASDFTDEVRDIITEKPYLVQELIPNGHDVQGAFYLYFDGKLVEAYSHQRLRTSPPTGGVTVLSKLDINKTLISEGEKILDKAGWNGLVMLEFLYDERTGIYKIIEANPRIWGSIMLSEYSGRNLLTNYVRLCMQQPLITNYRVGDTYIRWLFPVDLLNYVKKLGRIKDFWNMKDTCFINWTYANKWSAIQFNLANLFSIKNIKRFLRK